MGTVLLGTSNGEDRNVCLFSYFLGFSPTDLVQLNHRVCAVIQKDGTAGEDAFHQLVNQLQLMEARREQYANSSIG